MRTFLNTWKLARNSRARCQPTWRYRITHAQRDLVARAAPHMTKTHRTGETRMRYHTHHARRTAEVPDTPCALPLPSFPPGPTPFYNSFFSAE